MTVAELYHSVAQLGFDERIESAPGFVYAANRALLQVSALRPEKRYFSVNHRPLENMINDAGFSPVTVFGELTYEASDVRSYFFEADGAGLAYLERFDAESSSWIIIKMIALSSGKGFTAYRGLIKRDGEFFDGKVRIRFLGEYIYSVKCVAMYRYLLGPGDNAIPAYEAFTKYDLSVLVDDFLSFAAPPVVEEEGYRYLKDGYNVENGRSILLPNHAPGLYKLIYDHRPTPINHTGEEEDDQTVIDLDEELCALLPLLVAYYVWADDEPEKAQYYKMLYSERAAEVEYRARSFAPITYRTDGW